MTATKERKKATGTSLNISELRAALHAVSPVVHGKGPKPILQNVRLGDGLLSATDLEVRIDTEISYHGPAILLPHQRLLLILNASSSDYVTISPEGASCVVSCGNGRWTLPMEDAGEFPTWEVDGAKPLTRLPADQFARAIKGVAYAADTESSRFALGAVLVDVQADPQIVTLVATDGRRLCTVEMEHDLAVDDSQTLVPSRVMAILSRLAGNDADGSVQLEATKDALLATIGGTTVTARLTDGRFPKWRDVIPADGAEPSTVTAADLLSATRAAAIVTTESSKGVQYTFSKDGLHLHGQSSECGESSVTCDLVECGHACSVKLDPVFVSQWLTGLPPDGEPTVSVQATDAGSAVVLRCEDYTGVIMPLAVD